MTWTRRDSLVVAALVVAPFLFYWRLYLPVLLPGLERYYFEGGDFIDQFYAFAAHEVRSFAAGRLPLWNPYAYAGAPFWADIQAAVAYPPSLLVVLASAALLGRLPLLALELEAVAHVALAGVLTYLFARRVLASLSGAAVAALTFALGGYLTGYAPLQLAVLETSVWLPLALLGVVETLDRPLKLVARPGASLPVPHPFLPLALGMAILAGHPQSAMYVLYATLFYAAWRAWPWRDRGRATWARLGLGLALALALSAAGWLPGLQFMRLSNRAASDYAALAHGFPARELLGIVMAGITKWSPLYVGVLPLLLALAAAWRVLVGGDAGDAGDAQQRDGRFWIALCLVAVILSLGGGAILFDAFYVLAPGFDLFRGQERAAFLVSFSLAMLAGRGMAAWLDGARRVGRTVATGAPILAAFAFVLSLAAEPDLRPLALRLLLLSGAVSLLAAMRRLRRLPDATWLAAALLLIAGDLYLASGSANLIDGAPGEIQVTPQVAMLRASDAQRVHNEHRLRPNFGVVHEMESTSGASPLRLRTFDTLRDGLADTHEIRLWDLLAVSHVLTWREELALPAERLLATGEGDARTYLHLLDTATPFAWRAVTAESVPDEQAALARLRDEDLNPLSVALLHDGEGSGAAGSFGGLGLRSRRAGETIVVTNGDGPAWVVFAEMWYPGWRATVDGKPAPVLRADVALMAVRVPAGDHEVRLFFNAPLVTAGLLISALSLIVLVALAVASAAPGRFDGRAADWR